MQDHCVLISEGWSEVLSVTHLYWPYKPEKRQMMLLCLISWMHDPVHSYVGVKQTHTHTVWSFHLLTQSGPCSSIHPFIILHLYTRLPYMHVLQLSLPLSSSCCLSVYHLACLHKSFGSKPETNVDHSLASYILPSLSAVINCPPVDEEFNGSQWTIALTEFKM